MAKKTLLKLVQLLGESVSSDEIDQLDETIESLKIVNLLQTTYEEVISRRDWEFIRDRVLALDDREIGDTKLYNLAIPSHVTKLQCVKYIQNDGSFQELTYLQPCAFIEKLHQRDTALTEVTQIANDDGVLLNIVTDSAPQYYTSFNEDDLSFDAYDSTRGTGNVGVDSVIIANIVPVVDFTDPTATLPVPQRMESLILNEAIATIAVRERQTQDPRAERLARRQNIAMREREPKTQRDNQEVSHGRKTRSGR